MRQIYIMFMWFILIAFIGCKKEIKEPMDYKATPYVLIIPNRFPKPEVPDFNPLTIEGIRLGRKLYYDPILSTNGLSCSSCHIAQKSFSTPIFTTKLGEYISVPPHINLAWNPDYNWNGGEPILDRLCLGDFGSDFFNTNMNDLVSKLKLHKEYPKLFKEAFNMNSFETYTHEELQLKIVYALSQFMRTMVSSNSKLDKYTRNEAKLSPEEFDGLTIYMSEKGDCFHCHGYPLMTSNEFVNNGLDSNPTGSNMGRCNITGKQTDIGKFSVPTLRNIELTAPYMHDGRYKTLEEVIEFYNSGVHQNSPNISPLMTKDGKQHGLKLTVQQKGNLKAFLKTLTDTIFINNPDFK